MELTELQVQRLDPRAILPTRAHTGDAGLDLYALEPCLLAPGARATVRTGVAVEIPAGYAGLVMPRSGLAARSGIALVNAPGLIDAGYRGELAVLLVNTDAKEDYEVHRGDRIAQLVIQAVAEARFEPVAEDDLPPAERGAGGFGHSGR